MRHGGGNTVVFYTLERVRRGVERAARDPEKPARRPARSSPDAAFVDANTAGIHATISVLEVEGSPGATDPQVSDLGERELLGGLHG
jgi:hypothetical protein